MPKDDRKEAIGIIVASHCRVAEEMVRATELIVGRLDGFKAVSILPNQTMEETTSQLREALKEVEQGKGALILTDLFGGTPANISLTFLGPKVEVIFGMNLPMLIKLAGCRNDHTLKEAAQVARDYGRRHISIASEVLSRPVKAS